MGLDGIVRQLLLLFGAGCPKGAAGAVILRWTLIGGETVEQPVAAGAAQVGLAAAAIGAARAAAHGQRAPPKSGQELRPPCSRHPPISSPPI